MTRTRILRILRIAVSAVSGILCLMLIALWLRSYSFHDTVFWRCFGTWVVRFNSCGGFFEVHDFDTAGLPGIPPNWVSHFPKATSDWKADRYYIELSANDAGFGMPDNSEGYLVVVPHWFLVLLPAALASVPWLAWPRQFGLRTLLLVTTLVAVVLGLVVAMR